MTLSSGLSLLILFFIIGWWYLVQIRYFLQRLRSKSWPAVDAILQKGCLAKISFGEGASAPATFFGYAYIVHGVRYAGFFALYGSDIQVRKLQNVLVDCPIQIRYNPSDPNVSFLVEYRDFAIRRPRGDANSMA
jgi:hypothetical protein